MALNAHGDVVPPGEGWQHPPYGGEISEGSFTARRRRQQKRLCHLHLRPCDHCNRWANRHRVTLNGSVELHFTYDEEFGGELGLAVVPKLTRPDYLIAAGFSYQVVTAHNGCLQMEVTVHGVMAHAAIPHPGSMPCRARSASSMLCTNKTNSIGLCARR